MAAAIIPIVGSVASALAPVIPTVVKLVEGLFGSKTGDVKLSQATTIVESLARALAAAGKLAGSVPTKDAIVGMVELVVQQLNAIGALKGTATIPTTNAVIPTSFTGSATIIFSQGK